MSFSSLYVGTTGMKSHGERMGVIGNNLANVSTLGFRGSEVHFETLMSQFTTTGASPDVAVSQRGLGVGLGAILTDFNEGGFEPGTASTDLAIAGEGFFRVVNGDKIRYTRAGNFRFDEDGFLVDPNGFRVQGRTVSDDGVVSGASSDISLNIGDDGQITVPPFATREVSLSLNLGTNTQDEAVTDATDPFFAMLKSWNANATDGPLSEGSSSYSTSIKVYDDAGEAHTLTVHFDPVSASNASGRRTFEFVAGFDPAEDGRTGMSSAAGAGLAMSGTLTFDTSGQLVDMSAFSYSGEGDATDPANWNLAELSADGLPVFSMTFRNTDLTTGEVTTSGESTIALDLGLSATAWDSGAPATAAEVGSNAGSLPSMSTPTVRNLASTAYEGTSSTIVQSQDGSPEGYLMSINIDRTGMMVGNFSNGVHKDLSQLTLYTFQSNWGLRREGSNHFSETAQSGAAVEGTPDTDNLGAITSQTLETSNVDMAEQFVKMISTERGFQANSKVITTADMLLQTLVNMKR
ncbi:flagellar hook protein FlgE [Desulfobaculum xiamenense]|uniref:Flagellar hook protein FlgE n=1 Tax=Desulfobaculum xiamenense TaxID=995050 RepID=A0A846QHZ2_9BACT|nr:flagellar hook-basal body complex protein [Desulfobaculum xiamenense]NJB68466.1 flagellar hook protein FlgE [Desulfobaculum xiamenense]